MEIGGRTYTSVYTFVVFKLGQRLKKRIAKSKCLSVRPTVILSPVVEAQLQ